MISAFARTYAVFETLLSYADVENHSTALYEQKSLGDIFNAAGYKTFWIDNQGLQTWFTSGKGFVIGGLYDVLSHRFTKRYYALAPTDQWLVDTFIKKVQPDLSTKNFVLFHLMGNHIAYNERFPKSYSKFMPADIPYQNLHVQNNKDKQIVADYVNSLYYTDHILSEIFKLFKDKDALIIYLSDHAQDIFESGSTYGHKCSAYGVEIPFMIYVSDVFKQKHPEKLKLIAKAINKPFMSDDLIHSLLPLVGIHTKDNLESKNLFSPAFDTNRKRVYCDHQVYEKKPSANLERKP
ncbi:phosphoethanolamine transferase [Helicobacter suis]|nr:phosphoethanolamine transferase [Helicobacter suis]